jgi:hypothetical protein
LPAGKGQKLTHQPCATPSTIQYLAEIIGGGRVLAACQRPFRRCANSGEKIVEIMRNPAGKPAHSFQPRGFFQLRLAAPARGDVQHTQQGASFTAQGATMHFHGGIGWLISPGKLGFNSRWGRGACQGTGDDLAHRFLACFGE